MTDQKVDMWSKGEFKFAVTHEVLHRNRFNNSSFCLFL